jgi:class 3 adenylate cyclase/predicted ATPase
MRGGCILSGIADLGSWLRNLGLGEYEAAFLDNDIDGEILPELTADDLIGLGIASIGHRRKLLAAIASLRDAPPQAEVASQPVGPNAAARVGTTSAERRQLTIMFCDVVGSTELATRLDPEDLRDVIGAYHRCAADVLTRFGGFVAKYMGDGVLAYFGYPEAHEDDAERAVRASLAIIGAVGQLDLPLDLPLRLELRLGIATGLVVVGDLTGSGAAQERGVVGETPNLAARLQSLAEPNGIVIADATRRQIGNLFDLRYLGPQMLKGFAGATPVWQVISESAVASRFEALRSHVMPLVGRDEEIELLLRRWAQAKSGEGRAVLLSAEPGIGKSRLAEALAESVAAEPHWHLRYFCSPHHQDSALYPIIGQLERAAGFVRDDDSQTRRRKLADLLAPGKADADDLPLFAELLSLPAEETRSAVDLAAQRKKEMAFDALLRRLEALARQRPVLMVFEDLHWIDPTSCELLDRTIARIERLPVLLIVTFRLEFQAPWIGQAHVTMLALSRLGRREGTVLVQRLVGDAAALPAEIVDEIIERTDGVPLFIEEVTKVVLEAGCGARDLAAAIPGARAAVPATLQASLMARLDRLGPAAREIAQTGAAIGREFPYDLLAAVALRGEENTLGALDRLVAAGLLFQRGTPPAAQYQFKHALVQDIAYGTLLRGARQGLHGRIAAAIETRMPERIEREPEILAYHLAEAGHSERAALFWRKAGEKAVRRAANREAIGHFRRALALAETQPEGAERWRAELAILSQLPPPLMTVHGWSAPEAGEAVERAAAVGRRLESSREQAPAIANLWMVNAARGRFDRAEEISADLFRMARELGDEEILLQAHHCAWATQFFRGRFNEAANHIDAGAALYDEERHAHHRHIYLGHDPRVCSMNFGASVQTALGYLDRGRRLVLDGIALSRRLDHAPSRANTLWRACEAFVIRRDTAAVLTTATELVDLARTHGIAFVHAHALVYLGWAEARSGNVDEGIARLIEGRGMLAAMGARVHGTLALGLHAESLAAAGRYVEGLEQLRLAFEPAAETGEQSYASLLHRIGAELKLHAFGPTDATIEADLLQAIAIARQQSTKVWELGAATVLARLWGEQGRRAEGRELLEPVFRWFTEGFDTPCLIGAKSLLEELGS